MAHNQGVIYMGPGKVEVKPIDFPKLQNPKGKKINHGVILRVVSTNICGSDQHMVRGRTTAPIGMILGHEITGEVIEIGSDVEQIKVGDLCSVPFNVACGRCRNCKEQHTDVCLTVNDKRPGGAYGYVDLGGWIGGQAEYVMIPYADFNLLRFPDKAQAMEKIRDLTCLSDILPTGFHGCVNARVKAGSTVFIAGAGPVGLSAAASAFFLGASVVIMSDINRDRLLHAQKFGCEIINPALDIPIRDQINEILGVPEVDCAIDCVGFEAKGHDTLTDEPAVVLNQLMQVTRAAGAVGIQGLYVTEDPGAKEDAAKHGILSIALGLGWAKSLSFATGQTPVMKYNYGLMKAILKDRLPIAKAVNVEVISLQDAPRGYAEFDKGAPKKFVIDPHQLISNHRKS
jgi:glutathione-independent formaldehyde dehydrogenase